MKILHGIDFSRVPMFKESGQSPILGTIMANYAFVTTIPSWCSEKVPLMLFHKKLEFVICVLMLIIFQKKEVSVNKSLWSATTIATVVFFLLGYMGIYFIVLFMHAVIY